MTSTSSVPEPLTEPPTTASPSRFCAGIDSPVTSDSSTAEDPDSTRPSTGTRSPGRTRTRSPTPRSRSGTSRSLAVAHPPHRLRLQIHQLPDRLRAARPHHQRQPAGEGVVGHHQHRDGEEATGRVVLGAGRQADHTTGGRRSRTLGPPEAGRASRAARPHRPDAGPAAARWRPRVPPAPTPPSPRPGPPARGTSAERSRRSPRRREAPAVPR